MSALINNMTFSSHVRENLRIKEKGLGPYDSMFHDIFKESVSPYVFALLFLKSASTYSFFNTECEKKALAFPGGRITSVTPRKLFC